MVEQTHFYRDINIKKPQYKEDKVHPRVLTISRATQPWQVGIRFEVFFFFQFTLFLRSSPNIYSCLASLSARLPFLFFCFSDIVFLCLFFSRLIRDECNNPFATCVYIEPVPCLSVCSAVKHSVLRKTRDSCESGQRVAGRNLHIPFFRQDALGGVQTVTNQPIKCYRTITMSLNLLY
jgi:hypothetical protein